MLEAKSQRRSYDATCTMDGCVNAASRDVVLSDGWVAAEQLCRIHAVRVAIGINSLFDMLKAEE